MSSPSTANRPVYEETVMELEAATQYMELSGQNTKTSGYQLRIQRQRAVDVESRVAFADTVGSTFLAQSILAGLDGISRGCDQVEKGMRFEDMAEKLQQFSDELHALESAESEQARLEYNAYNSALRSRPTGPHETGDMSQAEQEAVRDLIAAANQEKSEEGTAEERARHLEEKAARCGRVLRILLEAARRNNKINETQVGMFEALLSSHSGLEAASRLGIESRIEDVGSMESKEHMTAGDWARWVVQTDEFGVDTLVGLARGFTRVVDASDASDWMSLLWEVAVCAPASALMRHDTSCPPERLVAELDRATEIFALSYRHRVHGDQAHGLRYRLPECCWAELRLVVEQVVEARPHCRVVLWWDQVLGATAGVEASGVAWATVGLLPYVSFRVVYNPPGRCRNHAPVFHGRHDFESVTDDVDIGRLWIDLEHRLALRGRGLLMSRRAGAQDCHLWSLSRTGTLWEGANFREIHGEDNLPMLGMRRFVAHLLREQLELREVTFPQDVEELRRWGATLAALSQRHWAPFLAGQRTMEQHALTVQQVVRVVLRAGACTTLDGSGPLLPSALTVQCPRVSHGGWSGVTEWAPLLKEPALRGWLSADVELEVTRELAKFTVWICFPVTTHAGEGVVEAVAIGKLWTPVQAVSSYMLVWLQLVMSLDECRECEMSSDDFGRVYADARVRKTQLVWPTRVRAFHEAFAGVHWALRCLGSSGANKAKDYPSGLFTIWKGRKPLANRALWCLRVPPETLFECLVEEWGPTISRNLAGSPISDKSGSEHPSLHIAAGVPLAVMSGEEVSWQGGCGLK